MLSHICYHSWAQQGGKTSTIILILHLRNLSQSECQSLQPFSSVLSILWGIILSQWKTAPSGLGVDVGKIKNTYLYVQEKQLLIKLVANQQNRLLFSNVNIRILWSIAGVSQHFCCGPVLNSLLLRQIGLCNLRTIFYSLYVLYIK